MLSANKKVDGMMKMKERVQVVSAEQHDGDTEYKRQLLPTLANSRIIKLTTQMSYRLDQGNSACIYQIGVEDDGSHSLLDPASMEETLQVLNRIARSLNSVIMEIKWIQGLPPNEVVYDMHEDIASENKEEKLEDLPIISLSAPRKLKKDLPTRCEVFIRRIETHLLEDVMTNNNASQNTNGLATKSSIEETLSINNIRIAVVGNVDAGKSTLIGTLRTSQLDDGRGSSRISIMKHRHEIETGRTSTATSHILGFHEDGALIKGRDTLRHNRLKSEDEIVKESNKLITLMDLAGHEKYLKTTIHGVASGFADYALILINARHPPTHMTHHHLNLCCSYGIPVICIFTKIDDCPGHQYQNCRESVIKLLRAPDVNKKPFNMRGIKDIPVVLKDIQTLCPLIDISSVTGEGLPLLKKFLHALPKRRKHQKKLGSKFEFLVEDFFLNVPGVGAVVSGFVFGGSLQVGAKSEVYIGPLDDGTFLKTHAKSAHISRINTLQISSGQNACIALSLGKADKKKLRRGMVVVKDPAETKSTSIFEAEICVLKGEGTTIRRKKYQAFVHILNVRQSAFATSIEMSHHHNFRGSGASALKNKSSDMEEKVGDEEDSDEDPEESIVLRPGSRARVHFEFCKRPEYVRPGMRMLFRDGRVRGVGKVISIPSVDDAVDNMAKV